MKDFKVSDKELLKLMDALNLLESAQVYTRSQSYDYRLMNELRDKIRKAYESE